ncbi:glycoside hydrolase family 88/105 protein [Aquirufa aurantiipilula]
MRRTIFLSLFLCFSLTSIHAQNWIDSLDRYGREVYMPAEKYVWDWGQATFLHSLIHLYQTKPNSEKAPYLQYIRTAMNKTYEVANGKHPNAIASGIGMAFLARITKEEKYKTKAQAIYQDYLNAPRSKNGGISHRTETVELWDDTVYMLNMFLMEMYRGSGDEKYLAHIYTQIRAHSQSLANPETGLWVHAWDDDDLDFDDGCSVLGWPDKKTRKSSEYWGRANGWVSMTLVDVLSTISPKSNYYEPLKKEFLAIMRTLPSLQNKQSGHWYQLLLYPQDAKNWEESSCTAMFAYSMAKGIELGLLSSKDYLPSIHLAYQGLKKYSLVQPKGPYLCPSRVSGGTCVGMKEYYYGRPIVEGQGFGIGSFIMFALEYQKIPKS